MEHKRTFLFLEQLILKHNLQNDCNMIVDIDGGLNFQYSDGKKGKQLVSFIQNNISCRSKQS